MAKFFSFSKKQFFKLLLTLWLRLVQGAPALKYGDVNTETTSPSEAKGLISKSISYFFIKNKCN